MNLIINIFFLSNVSVAYVTIALIFDRHRIYRYGFVLYIFHAVYSVYFRIWRSSIDTKLNSSLLLFSKLKSLQREN